MSKSFIIIIFIYLLAIIFPFHIHAVYLEEDQRSKSEYVANEVIVKFKPLQTPEQIQIDAEKRISKKGSGVTGKFQYYFETFKEKATGQALPEDKLQEIRRVEEKSGTKTYERFYNTNINNSSLNVLGATDSQNNDLLKVIKLDGNASVEDVVKEYNSLPEVEFASPNFLYHIKATPNDQLFSQMWALQKMELEKAWDISKGSDQVTVAVIDTGADYNHPDLKDHLLPGYNAMIGLNGAQDGNGHGTHTAGTIGAITDNSSGVTGVGWNIKVLAILALDANGSGSQQNISNGMAYAIQKADELHIKVISMSLGGPRTGRDSQTGQTVDTCQAYFNTQIQAAAAKNITVVIAAGNDSRDASNDAPASCPGVITVGATDQNDKTASFSNTGDRVTLSAPGVGILSTMWSGTSISQACRGQSYCTLSGTSMATPNVAGIIGLMYSVNSQMTPNLVKQILSSPPGTAGSGLDSGPSNIGAGRINAFKAVSSAQSAAVPTATPTPTTGTQPTATSTPGQNQTTPTSTPVPTTTPSQDYACTPSTLPDLTVPQGCVCSTGKCTTTCSFYEEESSTLEIQSVSEIVLGAKTKLLSQVTISNCPLNSTCTKVTDCTPLTRIVSGRICDLSSICCLDTAPTESPLTTLTPKATAFPTQIPISISPTQAVSITPSISPTISATPSVSVSPSPSLSNISCTDKDGKDNNSFCQRPLRTAGDVNGDGKVDMLDYYYFQRVKLSASVPNTINADIDGDNEISDKDRNILIQNLKKMCF